MIGQLNSLLPPIRPHTSLFYRQTFHPITDIFSLLLSILVPPPRETERERERSESTTSISSSSFYSPSLDSPSSSTRLHFFPLMLTGCRPEDFQQLPESLLLSSLSFLSVSPPFSLSLLLLFFPTSEASLLLPPLFYPFHTTRMWHSVALLLSGFSALIHGEPACMSLSLSFTLFSGNRIAAAF